MHARLVYVRHLKVHAVCFLSILVKHVTGLSTLNKTLFLFPNTTGPVSVARANTPMWPDHLKLGFPTSKCSVWAAWLS